MPTNTNTSPEAVERYEARRKIDRAFNTPSAALKEIRELKARAEAAEAERDEALNQLDSARHSVDVLEKRVGVFKAENARLREALTDMRDDKIAYRHASHFRRRAAVVLAALQEKDT
jgi:flagellar motility protein MotE (MotC chaperone)